MKWVYGKQDWKTFERGLENCYLTTNGLGGFSSLTMIGAVARNDHAVLMASIKAPNCRYNILHRIAERVQIKEKDYVISSQEFSDGTREDGWKYLSAFSYEDTAVWRFHINGIEIEKELAMKHGENTVAIVYRINNRTQESVKLVLIPFFQFVPKGQDLTADSQIVRNENQVTDGTLNCYFTTNAKVKEIPEKSETYYYSYDSCDGRRSTGTAKACHELWLDVEAKTSQTLAVVYAMEPCEGEAVKLAQTLINERKFYNQKLVEESKIETPLATTLVKSADQFLSERESTKNQTILAGYPFFEDWGRDTMIALPGICLSTKRYKEARSILRTFAKYEKNGLMPNVFPEGGKDPFYNTVDAALLFINCVWLYYEKTKDEAFVKEMYPVMKQIIEGYKNGTDFHIYMDKDGLISAGSGLEQVTWMDVRVGEILPTPRHGKPVEINAYWYNALCIMERFSKLAGESQEGYSLLAKRVKSVFRDTFWMEEKHCLKDVISGTKADTQIRCNQIWAVSMPFTMLKQEEECEIVDTVFEKLYTPYGLRTLAMEDEEFHPFYGGKMEERDLAYHQGTVWTFPLGGYYLAYLKVNKYSEDAIEVVKAQLETMEPAMREGCIGQLPEIYDGENPVSSKGCFAQAWSVGEILRVWEVIENR